MVITVRDVAGSADTAAEGDLLFQAMAPAVRANARDVVVSFAGITTATSSFVNASFVELLELMTLADIRQSLRVVNSSAQINDMIKRRLEQEALLKA